MLPTPTKSIPALLAVLLLPAACASPSDAGDDTAPTTHTGGSSDPSLGTGSESTGDDAPEYVERGRWTPSHHTTEYGGVVLSVWVPAQGTDDGPDTIDYTFSFKNPEFGASPAVVHGHALAGAPADPDGGPYPVVIFSHGFSANAVWYSHLPEHLASHGFVVVAPEHVEIDWLQNAASVIQRPRDVTTAIDYAEDSNAPGGALAGLLDLTQVAVVGHSFGGYTALAAAGAQLEMNSLDMRCADMPPEDPKSFLCMPLAGRAAELAELAELDTVPEGNWPSFGDPRVTAIVPIAGDAYMFDAVGLGKISVPMMAISGTADTGTPLDWGAQLAYDEVSSTRKSLVALEGAEHMLAANACEDLPWSEDFPYGDGLCVDPAWDKHEALDLIRHFCTAFLLATLKDDADAAAALAPEAVGFDRVAYVATF
jgi:predicted dienelactone hydrolase